MASLFWIRAGNPETTKSAITKDLKQLRGSHEQFFGGNLETKRVRDARDDIEAHTNVRRIENRALTHTGLSHICEISRVELARAKCNFLQESQSRSEPFINPGVLPVTKYLAC